MINKKTKIFSPPVMGDDSDDDLDLDVMGDESKDTIARDHFEAQVLGAFQPNPEFDAARSEANAELIQLLAQYLTDNPSQRFGQALKNLELATNDVALVEPQVQLKRAKAAMRRR